MPNDDMMRETYTRDNYKTLIELLEIAESELDAKDLKWLKSEWTLDPPGFASGDRLPHYRATWKDIEIFVWQLEGCGVDRYTIGEVFGIDPSAEPWIFGD